MVVGSNPFREVRNLDFAMVGAGMTKSNRDVFRAGLGRAAAAVSSPELDLSLAVEHLHFEVSYLFLSPAFIYSCNLSHSQVY